MKAQAGRAGAHGPRRGRRSRRPAFGSGRYQACAVVRGDASFVAGGYLSNSGSSRPALANARWPERSRGASDAAAVAAACPVPTTPPQTLPGPQPDSNGYPTRGKALVRQIVARAAACTRKHKGATRSDRDESSSGQRIVADTRRKSQAGTTRVCGRDYAIRARSRGAGWCPRARSRRCGSRSEAGSSPP
jgi:hypothetical protein